MDPCPPSLAMVTPRSSKEPPRPPDVVQYCMVSAKHTRSPPAFLLGERAICVSLDRVHGSEKENERASPTHWGGERLGRRGHAHCDRMDGAEREEAKARPLCERGSFFGKIFRRYRLVRPICQEAYPKTGSLTLACHKGN
jgi:hypothetical protein